MKIIRNGKVGKTKTFENTPEGHAAVINYISSNKHHVKVCLEATGTYHFDYLDDQMLRLSSAQVKSLQQQLLAIIEQV